MISAEQWATLHVDKERAETLLRDVGYKVVGWSKGRPTIEGNVDWGEVYALLNGTVDVSVLGWR